MGWKTNDLSIAGVRPAGDRRRDARGAGHGIVAGTLVATSMGWRPVEALMLGDEVMTFDGGMQRITGLSRARLWNGEAECPRAMWPIRVPAGLVGNRRDLVLMPEETVVIESDAAEDMYDDPFALIPAMALIDMPGVERVCPATEIEVVSISFDEDQVIFVEGSALIFCPTGAAGEPIGMAALLSEEFNGTASSAYQVLSLDDARLLASCMVAEQAARGVPAAAARAGRLAA
ncbi:Hint domain-containing protein [Vannielia litorea]|uniref:Hint domain-containing protein n=1 Tax=Vannielia litorea TaxID=1217970 RepID=UPI001C9704A7|nr:Hint domain-containing protein [Vannielia litorea]MBY6050033.1 Hint domain-containing protein [Vannielia litorea]MBY6077447.1 Hint domain-containing protein [Vannielia litorea]